MSARKIAGCLVARECVVRDGVPPLVVGLHAPPYQLPINRFVVGDIVVLKNEIHAVLCAAGAVHLDHEAVIDKLVPGKHVPGNVDVEARNVAIYSIVIDQHCSINIAAVNHVVAAKPQACVGMLVDG